MRGSMGSSQTEQHVSGLLSVIYEASQPQPSLCSRDAGGVSLLRMLFHILLDLGLSECIKELHLDRESAIHDGLSLYTPWSPSKRYVWLTSAKLYVLFPFPLANINIVFAIKQTPPSTTPRSKVLFPIDLCAWEDNWIIRYYFSQTTPNEFLRKQLLQLHTRRCATVQLFDFKQTKGEDTRFMSLWGLQSAGPISKTLFFFIQLCCRGDSCALGCTEHEWNWAGS